MRGHLLSLAVVAVLSFTACGDDGGGGDDDTAAATCDSYCDTITANCSGVENQYTNRDQCLAVCGAFDQGTAGTMAGNNLECRNYHAGAALGDPTTHCVHSGPGGAGACGANCEGFCTLVLDTCTGANEVYADMAACMTACAGFDATEKYDVSDTGGDTFACRLYHAAVATSDATTHCPHTGAVSATCN
jgi:hypothetical protein